jgi:orotidine-5'-phosphate decarboxylase
VTSQHFADRLLAAIEAKQSHVVVGFDPDYDLIPSDVTDAHRREAYGSEREMKAACYRQFLGAILETVCDDAVAVKIQIAHFEALGALGYALYEDLVKPARERGLLVIADVKRGDIGNTAEAYARAHLDGADVDAVTVNPYLGTDSVEPFVRRAREAGKGDLELSTGEPLYRRIAGLVNEWGRGTEGTRGYRAVGAVVAGTHPKEGAELRAQMPGVPLLVPGYGAQGAQARDLAGLFDAQGTGAVVNSSRAILYAYRKQSGMDWQEAARREVKEMKAALWEAAGRG